MVRRVRMTDSLGCCLVLRYPTEPGLAEVASRERRNPETNPRIPLVFVKLYSEMVPIRIKRYLDWSITVVSSVPPRTCNFNVVQKDPDPIVRTGLNDVVAGLTSPDEFLEANRKVIVSAMTW